MNTPTLSLSEINRLTVTQLVTVPTAEDVDEFARAYGEAAVIHSRAVDMYDQAIDEVPYKELQLYWQNVVDAAAKMQCAWLEWDAAKTTILALQS